MSIKFFLDSLTPQATKYVSTVVKSNNQESYRKLKKMFLDQSIELKGFEDTTLDITNFNWSGVERDRNWWWQVQALPFLNWYIDSYNLQDEEERKKYFSLCIGVIDNWNIKTESYESPLAWHDHGTAFRTRNIVNWITFCYIRDAEVIALSDDINLSKLIIEHLEWLLDSANYSKHTNHGFDQAMILLTISIMFNNDELEPQRLVSRQRLEEEIKFAFTDEGVHKENSPGYQKFMLGRLKQLRSLKPLGEQIISDLAESYIEKAEEFLRVITLPDGYLPMIGDTKGFEVGLPYENISQEKYKVFDYSKSGYIVVRGEDEMGKDFFILLKNTHESNYHRHDDDMMIYLFYENKVIFGDGGLYNHQENDPKRKNIRSFLSHSIPYIDKAAIRDKNIILEKPVIKIKDSLNFYLESAMFGEKIKREISISLIPYLEINIVDSLIENIKQTVSSNFFFEQDYPLYINDESLDIDFSNFKLHMNFYSDASSKIIQKGWSITDLERGAYVSREYGKVSEAMRISVTGRKKKIYFS